MVSTRQMSIGHASGGDGGGQSLESGPAKCTRNSTNTALNPYKPAPAQTVRFLDLPQEVIEHIFSYFNFKMICQLRLVCRTIDRICSHILNSTFQKLQVQTLQRFQSIKSKMPRRESARRTHHLACESDIIETLHMRLTLLQMSFGKHIERKHCCFFPGEILDEVYHILHYIRVTPKLPRPYNVTDELFDLSTMAMEYFKEKIEPNLPEIAYFGSEFFNFSNSFTTSSTHLALGSSETLGPEDDAKDRSSHSSRHDVLDVEELSEAPQSNMVLRKRIKKIKQGMKRYNSQLTILRQDLRTCKRKTAEQQKQISDQQKQLAEQQQQTLEYATRLDEYDKKNEEISRKFSTLLQELNKCKTELQYWRSKSPATPPFCSGCGNLIRPHPEEMEALANQGVDLALLEPSDLINPEDFAAPLSPLQQPPPQEVVAAVAAADITSELPTKHKRKLEEVEPEPGTSNNSPSKKTRRRSKVRGKRAKV